MLKVTENWKTAGDVNTCKWPSPMPLSGYTDITFEIASTYLNIFTVISVSYCYGADIESLYVYPINNIKNKIIIMNNFWKRDLFVDDVCFICFLAAEWQGGGPSPPEEGEPNASAQCWGATEEVASKFSFSYCIIKTIWSIWCIRYWLQVSLEPTIPRYRRVHTGGSQDVHSCWILERNTFQKM